ncbi:MAG: (4Fe-4S)-binding protein [Lactobacillales bacterium]|nr:(4Fe-4S)-binding protein [Lactobacillales bacterium]
MDNSLFEGKKATHEALTKADYKRYEGEYIDVYFKLEDCIHVAKCLINLPEVFNVKRRPWVCPANASAEDVAKTCDLCPVGALKYIMHDDIQELDKHCESPDEKIITAEDWKNLNS